MTHALGCASRWLKQSNVAVVITVGSPTTLHDLQSEVAPRGRRGQQPPAAAAAAEQHAHEGAVSRIPSALVANNLPVSPRRLARFRSKLGLARGRALDPWTMMLRAGVRRCSTTTLDVIRRDPFKSALVVTTAKTVAADLLVQLAIERREWEPRRTALFAAFGFAYQGAVQYCVVNVLLEGMFPGQTARAVVAKCALMNGVADPFFFLPTFYIFKETIRNTQLPDRTTVRPAAPTPLVGPAAPLHPSISHGRCQGPWPGIAKIAWRTSGTRGCSGSPDTS